MYMGGEIRGRGRCGFVRLGGSQVLRPGNKYVNIYLLGCLGSHGVFVHARRSK